MDVVETLVNRQGRVMIEVADTNEGASDGPNVL